MNSKAGKPSDFGLRKICPVDRIQTARAGGHFFCFLKPSLNWQNMVNFFLIFEAGGF